jgi:hypothetical protein
MENVNPKVELNLDASRLTAIIDSAVITSIEVVNLYFQALATANLENPADTAGGMYRFTSPQITAAQRRAMHENWILAKAFQDLLRAVRLALEKAHVYVSLLTMVHTVKTDATLLEFMAPFQRKAAKTKFS